MPVIILLDTSYSMNQNAFISNKHSFYSDHFSRLHLAQHGLNVLLNYLKENNKFELVSLFFFSRTCDLAFKSSRDFASLQNCIANVLTHDKTNLVNALVQVSEYLKEEPASDSEYNLLVITDGNALLQSSFMNKSIISFNEAEGSSFDITQVPLPLPHKCKIHIICMTTLSDQSFQRSQIFYKEIIIRNLPNKSTVEVNVPCDGGQIIAPDVQMLSHQVIEEVFLKLCSDYFKPYNGRLFCGNLHCPISLYPNLKLDPIHQKKKQNIDRIHICGFLNEDEIGKPPVHSRHLLLPMAEKSIDEFKKWISFINVRHLSDDEIEKLFNEEGRQPSFAVLLHGSFKTVKMAALCQIGTCQDWYGIITSSTENKKKSNLVLLTLEPGTNPIPWLPDLQTLGLDMSVTESNRVVKKPTNYYIWVKQTSLQNDIQKIIRLTRKLPDKHDNLLTEVNRVRRIANALYFQEVIQGLIHLLERESRNPPIVNSPDSVAILNKIIKSLKEPMV